MDARALMELFREALASDPAIGRALRADIRAYYDRDPACDAYSTPLLYYKGFHVIESQRITHWLVVVLFGMAGFSGLALFHPNLFFLTQFFGGPQWARIVHPYFGIGVFLLFYVMAIVVCARHYALPHAPVRV